MTGFFMLSFFIVKNGHFCFEYRYWIKTHILVPSNIGFFCKIINTSISLPILRYFNSATFYSTVCILFTTVQYLNDWMKNHQHSIGHRWELLVLHYHKIMVIYSYPFLVVLTQLLNFLMDNIYQWLYMCIKLFTWIILFMIVYVI